MDIEVGEWVRTNDGIKRIDTIFENKTVNKYGYEIGSEWDGKLYSYIKTTEVVKHSKSILDLIEVGDFVNGYKITQIITETNNETKEEKIHLFSGREDTNNKNFAVGHIDSIFEVVTEYEPIKTILTHEQYEQNCYRLEE